MLLSNFFSRRMWVWIWKLWVILMKEKYVVNVFLCLFYVCLQLILHETDLLFRYLSHHLKWHCSSIYEDLHRFAQIWAKNCFIIVVLLNLFRNNNKNNFALISVQIFINTGSNDGLSIEIIDQSHGDIAEILFRIWDFVIKSTTTFFDF